MVAYWTGLSTLIENWQLEEDAGTTPTPVTLTSFPVFSNYSADEPTVSSYDLNFGMEAPFFPIPVNPANTLYFEYWAQYVTELYSDEAPAYDLHHEARQARAQTLNFRITSLSRTATGAC